MTWRSWRRTTGSRKTRRAAPPWLWLVLRGEALGRKLERVGVAGRSGFAERKKTDIGLLSVRAGDIAGEHTVIFGGIGERIELVHRAHSRDAFGRGAIRAAQWLADQASGLYGMQDVLGRVPQ